MIADLKINVGEFFPANWKTDEFGKNPQYIKIRKTERKMLWTIGR
jgi:hypothetical protein